MTECQAWQQLLPPRRTSRAQASIRLLATRLRRTMCSMHREAAADGTATAPVSGPGAMRAVNRRGYELPRRAALERHVLTVLDRDGMVIINLRLVDSARSGDWYIACRKRSPISIA